MTLNKIQLWCIGSFILLAYYAGEKISRFVANAATRVSNLLNEAKLALSLLD